MAILRLATTWTGSAGSPYFTESYFNGAGDATHASACVSALWTLYGSLATYIDDNLVESISGDAEKIDVMTGQIIGMVPVTGAVNGGSATGDALPTLVQGLARFGTGVYVNGRALRGRMFLPGMMEANNTVDGRPAAGMTGTMNTHFATYIASSANPCVYSKTHKVFADITSATLSSKWAFLKTRRD